MSSYFKKLIILLNLSLLVGSSAIASDASGSGNGGDYIRLNEGEPRLIIADPYLQNRSYDQELNPSDSHPGSAKAEREQWITPDRIKWLHIAKALFDSYGAKSSFFDENVLDFDHYILLPSIPNIPGCDAQRKYDFPDHVFEQGRFGCTVADITFLKRDLFVDNPENPQEVFNGIDFVLALLHERLFSLKFDSIPVEAVAQFTTSFKRVLELYKDQHVFPLQKDSFLLGDDDIEAIEQFVQGIVHFGLAANNEFGSTDVFGKKYGHRTMDISRNGGGLIHEAVIKPNIYVGVGSYVAVPIENHGEVYFVNANCRLGILKRHYLATTHYRKYGPDAHGNAQDITFPNWVFGGNNYIVDSFIDVGKFEINEFAHIINSTIKTTSSKLGVNSLIKNSTIAAGELSIEAESSVDQAVLDGRSKILLGKNGHIRRSYAIGDSILVGPNSILSNSKVTAQYAALTQTTLKGFISYQYGFSEKDPLVVRGLGLIKISEGSILENVDFVGALLNAEKNVSMSNFSISYDEEEYRQNYASNIMTISQNSELVNLNIQTNGSLQLTVDGSYSNQDLELEGKNMLLTAKLDSGNGNYSADHGPLLLGHLQYSYYLKVGHNRYDKLILKVTEQGSSWQLIR